MVRKAREAIRRQAGATSRRSPMTKACPLEERFEARLKLAELPRNSSKTRIRNRCEVTGRPRAFIASLR
jgi:hypothetical protein